jgi:cytochrome c-type biogenesis protein
MEHALEMTGVFGAGALTLVTPCVLPMIPLYLALLMGGAQKKSRFTLLANTGAFSAGMIAVFVALGLTATALGSLLTEHRTELVLVGGLVVFLFGLKFMGALRLPFLEREKRLDGDRLQASRWPLLNSLLMGVVFSLGWTPCVGPMLGSVLTYTASTTSDPLTGAGYLAVYGLGFTLPLLVLSLFADAARRLVTRIGPWLPRLEKASGALLLVVGLYLMLGVTAAPSAHQGEGEAMAATSGPAVSISPQLGQATPRPRMVQFTSASCTICRQMIPTVALIERDCDGRKVDVVKVDLSRGSNRALATRYRVRGVPTFVFLDRQGAEVARLVGHQSLGSLRQSLAAMVGEQCDGLGLFPMDTTDTTDTTEPPPFDPGATCEKKGQARCGS